MSIYDIGQRPFPYIIQVIRDRDGGHGVEMRRYFPERTCRKVPGRMKYGRWMPECSECGQSLGDKRWKYCPNCGARVVQGDD